MVGSLHSDFLLTARSFLWARGVRSRVQVSVRLSGPYKRAARGVEEVRLDVEEPTLGGVLAALGRRYPEAARELEPSPGKIEPAVRVVLNDTVLQSPTMAQPVGDGDRVAFVPIVGGG